jgi:sialate O-acetylesterase
MKYLNIYLALLVIETSAQLSRADINVANIFSDNMVLHRYFKVKVWGNADPGEKLTVSFNGQKLKTKADKTGKWLYKRV